jgi:hypothetical protein
MAVRGWAWASGGYPDHVHVLCQRGSVFRIEEGVNQFEQDKAG